MSDCGERRLVYQNIEQKSKMDDPSRKQEKLGAQENLKAAETLKKSIEPLRTSLDIAEASQKEVKQVEETLSKVTETFRDIGEGWQGILEGFFKWLQAMTRSSNTNPQENAKDLQNAMRTFFTQPTHTREGTGNTSADDALKLQTMIAKKVKEQQSHKEGRISTSDAQTPMQDKNMKEQQQAKEQPMQKETKENREQPRGYLSSIEGRIELLRIGDSVLAPVQTVSGSVLVRYEKTDRGWVPQTERFGDERDRARSDRELSNATVHFSGPELTFARKQQRDAATDTNVWDQNMGYLIVAAYTMDGRQVFYRELPQGVWREETWRVQNRAPAEQATDRKVVIERLRKAFEQGWGKLRSTTDKAWDQFWSSPSQNTQRNAWLAVYAEQRFLSENTGSRNQEYQATDPDDSVVIRETGLVSLRIQLDEYEKQQHEKDRKQEEEKNAAWWRTMLQRSTNLAQQTFDMDRKSALEDGHAISESAKRYREAIESELGRNPGEERQKYLQTELTRIEVYLKSPEFLALMKKAAAEKKAQEAARRKEQEKEAKDAPGNTDQAAKAFNTNRSSGNVIALYAAIQREQELNRSPEPERGKRLGELLVLVEVWYDENAVNRTDTAWQPFEKSPTGVTQKNIGELLHAIALERDRMERSSKRGGMPDQGRAKELETREKAAQNAQGRLETAERRKKLIEEIPKIEKDIASLAGRDKLNLIAGLIRRLESSWMQEVVAGEEGEKTQKLVQATLERLRIQYVSARSGELALAIHVNEGNERENLIREGTIRLVNVEDTAQPARYIAYHKVYEGAGSTRAPLWRPIGPGTEGAASYTNGQIDARRIAQLSFDPPRPPIGPKELQQQVVKFVSTQAVTDSFGNGWNFRDGSWRLLSVNLA